ncbi:proline--tRNA ligase [Nocardioides ferulae]|uniref:proline--tRNA ligase n=1 Tax=Nocardioides ferulae TaxID=2340821 RepID=UPI001F0C5A6C|nr:proline--tRNA ligase [Nocardioides ferulae]
MSQPRVLRMSSLFVRTLREDPADAEVPSHRLLVRAGYIRRAAPGIYTWLPLGLKVLRRIESIIREEMDSIGAQELSFPALLPREPYESTGRWTEYGDNIFRLQDRKGGDYLLGPTHEEMFTLVVKDLYSSYKDLPLSIYQIQTKYRDEARPRAGLLRGREFVMKDSYSFDVDDAGLEASYGKHRDAYIRIFDRLGFEYVIVSAMSGAMGGSMSEEFLARADNGEDTYVRCSTCDYAANVEAVRVPAPTPVGYDDAPPAHAEATPDTPTIETLVDHLNERFPRDDRPWTAADTLKNVLVLLHHPDGTREPLAIGVPGDREVDLKRLDAQVYPAEIEAFDEAQFKKHPSLAKGYIGPGVLGEKNESGIRYLVDPRVVEGTRWVTGADVDGSHVIDLVAGRDFTPDGTIEAAEVREGDPCPNGDGTLHTARGIEMGHIFALGRKFADALGLQVLDESGKLVTVTMGSYGIGASRAVAAIAENTHDELGLVWPREVAPADVHLVAAGKEEAVFAAAERIARELDEKGVTVLYDDRTGKVSPGVKFKDAELIGVPTIVVVGKGLADGVVEVKDRRSGQRDNVAVDEVVDHLMGVLRG